MANSSISAAFERMWQHTVAALGNKFANINLDLYGRNEELQVLDTTWVQGGFNSTGDGSVSANRIRSNYLQDNTLTLVAADGYTFGLYAWDSSNNYLGRLVVNNTFSSVSTDTIIWHKRVNLANYPSEYKYKIAVKNTNNTDMIIAEGSNIYFVATTGVTGIEEKIGYLQTYVTPQMFGAKGDGITNDTAAINEAINSLSDGGMIYFPAGTYIVNHGGTNNTSAINVVNKNNITFHLDNAAKIKHSLTNSSYYKIINFNNCNGIEVCGGTIEGESDEHTNREVDTSKNLTNVSSFGLYLQDCNDAYIHDMDIAKCYGDGIGVFTSSSSMPQMENILIENCSIYDHIRNGVVYSGVKNGIVRNCHIYNIAPDGVGTETGCLPMAGIDLEKHSSAKNENITIEGCYIHDCGQFTIIHSLGTYGSFIKNCNLIGDVTESAGSDDMNLIDSIARNVATRNTAKIKGCTIESINVYNDSNEQNSDAKLIVNDTVILGRKYGAGTIQSNNVSVKASFKNCSLTHLEDAAFPLFYCMTPGTVDVTLEDCHIHLWSNSVEVFVCHNSVFDNINLFDNVFIIESETFTKSTLKLQTNNKTMLIGNTFDVTKVTSYSQNAVVVLDKAGESICSNNTFLSQTLNTSLCDNVFDISNLNGNLYIINNNAPTWNSIATNSTAGSTNNGKTLLIRDNILSTTPNLNAATEETWTFTLEDGTTVEKKVVVL